MFYPYDIQHSVYVFQFLVRKRSNRLYCGRFYAFGGLLINVGILFETRRSGKIFDIVDSSVNHFCS